MTASLDRIDGGEDSGSGRKDPGVTGPRWNRLHLHGILAAAYLCGLAASLILCGRVVTLLGLAGGLSCTVCVITTRGGGIGSRLLPLLLACGFALLGISLGSMRLLGLQESILAGLAGRQATLELEVIKAPRSRQGKVSFIAEAEGGSYRGSPLKIEEKVLVELYCDGSGGHETRGSACTSIGEGSHLRATGTLRETRASPGGDFDYSLYLSRRGVHSVITAREGAFELMGSRGGFAGLIDSLRRHSRRSLEAGARGDAGGLLKGMVLGDTSDVSDGTVDDLRDSGLLHLLAVSGQNVVLLGFVLMLICRALYLSRPIAAVTAIAAVLAYVPLTGADPSIVRAGFVGVMGLLAELSGRQAPRLYLLALSAAALMTFNPNSLLEPGFQLSYAAVLAIFFLAPVFGRLLGFLPGPVAEAMAISAACSLATAPITLAHFQQVSLVSVAANLAAAPVAGPVMFLGVLSVMAAYLSLPLSWALNMVSQLFTGYLVATARFFAAVPGAVYVGAGPGLLPIAIFYAMLFIAVFVIDRKKTPCQTGASRRQLIFGLALAVLLISGGFACLGGTRSDPPAAYTVSVLDVGQGDATLIQVPGGATVLVDGGPGSTVLDRLRESGVERLDAVVLTHPHADHLEGLTRVMEKYDVEVVYDAASPSTSPLYADFLRLIERKHLDYQVIRQGDTLGFGGLELEVFSPGDIFVADDANANSVVLVASYEDMDVLLPGDAESSALLSLGLPQVEAVKISHHGSRDDELGHLLEAVEPEAAIISVAEVNDYGHPAASTLETLRSFGVRVYRTDQDDTVRLTLVDGNMVVSTVS